MGGRAVKARGKVDVFSLETRELPSLVTSVLSLTAFLTAGTHWLANAFQLLGIPMLYLERTG